MSELAPTPKVTALTVAGSDPSGGAGLLAALMSSLSSVFNSSNLQRIRISFCRSAAPGGNAGSRDGTASGRAEGLADSEAVANAQGYNYGLHNGETDAA